MLTAVEDGLWVLRRPLSMMGLHMGTRMTILRLDDGGLFVHSPVSLDDALKREIDELGPVRHIVAPNHYHHLYAGDFKAAYPDAKLHGVPSLLEKRKDVAWDAELADEPDPGWQGQLEQIPFRGTLLKEVLFFRPSTRTIISCDLVENFSEHDHWFTRGYLKMAGVYGKPGMSWFLRPMFRDRKAVRASLEKLLAREPERIVLSHGDVIESGGARVLKETYSFL